jgi:hypothetical protein
VEEQFEWFDPFEQKQRADRETQRANGAYADGRAAVEKTIARAVQNHLSEKLDAAVTAMAERIARKAVFNMAAKMGYHNAAHRYGDEIGEVFRFACQDILSGLELPKVTRMRVAVSPDFQSGEEEMVMQFETLRPIHVAYRIFL